MTDADLMLTLPDLEFGSGIVGVCDVCGKRQAVIVLQKERYKLCVIDFLNKKWIGSSAKPGVPAPLFRSERIFFPTTSVKAGQAQAVVLSPTRVVKHPAVLITPDVHGLTTAILDGAIRLADVLPAQADGDPEAAAVESEEVAALRHAVDELPERQRHVITLHLFEGFTFEQIGLQLGVTASRVCQIEAAAICTLRELLGRFADEILPVATT